MSEDVVLIRAMRDSNLPKFLANDLILFMGIIKDLFPGIEIPENDYPDLDKAIRAQLDLEHLQKPKTFLDKITQLIETMKVRHGVMIVGETGTGKTKCYQILQKSLIQLWKDKVDVNDFWYKNVQTFKLNPKSVTMFELFGFVNVLTNEWADGIVAKIIREAVTDQSDNKKWVVFDGPVDAMWIENLNTVLDDNKVGLILDALPEQRTKDQTAPDLHHAFRSQRLGGGFSSDGQQMRDGLHGQAALGLGARRGHLGLPLQEQGKARKGGEEQEGGGQAESKPNLLKEAY